MMRLSSIYGWRNTTLTDNKSICRVLGVLDGVNKTRQTGYVWRLYVFELGNIICNFKYLFIVIFVSFWCTWFSDIQLMPSIVGLIKGWRELGEALVNLLNCSPLALHWKLTSPSLNASIRKLERPFLYANRAFRCYLEPRCLFYSNLKDLRASYAVKIGELARLLIDNFLSDRFHLMSYFE